MVHVEIGDLYKKKYSFLWCLLSFKAGLLNAAGFLIAGSYVSHVTGFGTQVGIAIGHSEYNLGFELLVIPVSFIFGAFLSATILDRDFSKDKIPNYPVVQILITALLATICVLFYFGILSTERLSQKNSWFLLFIGLLCLVCGLKNGLATWATHGKIRTTHLTGLATDIGLHLPKFFKSAGGISRYPEPRIVNRVRVLTLISFSVGSCLSALLIQLIEYRIFYIAFGISIVFSVISIIHRELLIDGRLRNRVGGKYANSN